LKKKKKEKNKRKKGTNKAAPKKWLKCSAAGLRGGGKIQGKEKKKEARRSWALLWVDTNKPRKGKKKGRPRGGKKKEGRGKRGKGEKNSGAWFPIIGLSILRGRGKKKSGKGKEKKNPTRNRPLLPGVGVGNV